MRRLFCINAALFSALLMLGAANTVYADKDANKGTELKTRLAGGAILGKTPEGSAKFRASASRMQLTVEVEHVNLAAGTELDVAVSHGGVGALIGSITVSAFGEGELELDSRHGDTVPALVKGDMVTVSNGGTAILSGAF
jgi:hypothetical protein